MVEDKCSCCFSGWLLISDDLLVVSSHFFYPMLNSNLFVSLYRNCYLKLRPTKRLPSFNKTRPLRPKINAKALKSRHHRKINYRCWTANNTQNMTVISRNSLCKSSSRSKTKHIAPSEWTTVQAANYTCSYAPRSDFPSVRPNSTVRACSTA